MRWALAGLTAMLTLLAFQAGTAFASYDLQIYKAEKQVDLNSDDTTVKLSCNAGDYALDGMWRLDEVDQDNDSTFAEQMTSIDVLQAENEEAAGISSDEGTYDFRFVKNAIGARADEGLRDVPEAQGLRQRRPLVGLQVPRPGPHPRDRRQRAGRRRPHARGPARRLRPVDAGDA